MMVSVVLISIVRCLVIAWIIICSVGFAMTSPQMRDWPTVILAMTFLIAMERFLWVVRKRISRDNAFQYGGKQEQ